MAGGTSDISALGEVGIKKEGLAQLDFVRGLRIVDRNRQRRKVSAILGQNLRPENVELLGNFLLLGPRAQSQGD
jgi:hypothetical protein